MMMSAPSVQLRVKACLVGAVPISYSDKARGMLRCILNHFNSANVSGTGRLKVGGNSFLCTSFIIAVLSAGLISLPPAGGVLHVRK